LLKWRERNVLSRFIGGRRGFFAWRANEIPEQLGESYRKTE
jgi:hypothetical protein